jgi:hypothetical protein
MRFAPVLLALAALAAGCVTPPAAQVEPAAATNLTPQEPLAAVVHGANATALPVPATDFLTAVGGGFKHGMSALEPTIGVDGDGSVYVTAIKDLQSPTLMRSDDGGLTWTEVGAPAHLITFDPYVYVDPATGRVFQDDIQPIGCGWLSYSDDKGDRKSVG